MLLSLASALLLNACDSAEKEIHLIPSGYQGPITIVFDCPEGVDQEFEGEPRVYRIGQDGVLKVRSAFNSGLLSPGNSLFLRR